MIRIGSDFNERVEYILSGNGYTYMIIQSDHGKTGHVRRYCGEPPVTCQFWC